MVHGSPGTQLESLPTELLVKILGMSTYTMSLTDFVRLSAVSRFYRELCARPELYRFAYIEGIPTSSGLRWLALRSTQTTRMLFWAKGFYPFQRDQEAGFNEGLEVLLRACGRQLTHLESATNQVPSGLDDASFEIISNYCTELRVWETCVDHVDHPLGMSLIAARCQKLGALHFLHYEADGIDSEAAEALAWGCPELRVLNLPGTELSPDGLAAIGRGCKKLKTLVLRDCATLQSFREAATFCSQSLEHIAFHETAVVPDDIWWLLKACPSLKQVIVRVTEWTVELEDDEGCVDMEATKKVLQAIVEPLNELKKDWAFWRRVPKLKLEIDTDRYPWTLLYD